MDKTRQWSILTAVGVIAVLVAGWFLLVSPQRSHAADLRSQAAAQQQSNATLQSKVSMLRQQAKDLPRQQARLAEIAKKVPDNPALPPLIRALSDAADTSGVDLVSLAPSPPTAVTSVTGTATAQSAAKAAPGATPLAQIPVSIQVRGTYFNVEQFFNAVESLSRAMLVTGLSMAPIASSGAPTQAGQKAIAPGSLTATVTAKVFMAPTVALPTAAKPAASAPAAK